MFRKILVVLALGVVALGGAKGLRAESVPTASFKFGMVDFQKALHETEEGKKTEQNLNAAAQERQKKFEMMKNELNTLKQDYDKQQLVLSGKPLEEKKQALQKKLMEVEQTGAGYEQELAQKRSEAVQKIVSGLQTVVQDIGKKEGFTMIFEKSQGAVVFTSDAQDITERVIKEFNAKPKK